MWKTTVSPVSSTSGSLDLNGEMPISRTMQYRKVTKPLLERKRRARINRCLDELKDLMVCALQAEGDNVSKLEKADILELTVRYLHKLNTQTRRSPLEDAHRFQAGFAHCARETFQYMCNLPGVDVHMSHRLMAHLSSYADMGSPTGDVPQQENLHSPLTVQVPSAQRPYSPPISPGTPTYRSTPYSRQHHQHEAAAEYVPSCTPSAQDLSKPMGLLMPANNKKLPVKPEAQQSMWRPW